MSRFPRHGLAGSRARWWRRLRWIDVLLLSVVPVAVAGYLIAQSIAAFATAQSFDDYWSRSRDLPGEVSARLSVMANTPRLVRQDRALEAREDDPNILSLIVPDAEWRALSRDPQAGFETWIEASVAHEGRLDPVRLRKRGDNSIHWITPKMSFTLRTPRESLLRGVRSMGFSVKDVIPQFVASRVSEAFGLFGARQEIVPVFVNRRFYGLHRMIEAPDESMLRRVRRMPGNIYRGDAAERGEYFKSLPRSLFQNPYIWDRVAVSDRPSGPPSTRMFDLLEALHDETIESHRRLMAIVDTTHLASLMAAMLVVGDPYHMDDVHNQLWYQDPSNNRLYLLPWDLRLLDLARPSIGVNEFWQQALRDPFLVDATLQRVRLALDAGLVAKVDSLLAVVSARYGPFIRFEELRGDLVPPIGSVDSVRVQLTRNLTVLEQWMQDAQIAYATGPASPGLRIMDFESRGMTGVDLMAIRVAGGAPGLAVVLDTDRNGNLDPTDVRVTGRWQHEGTQWEFTPKSPVALLPGWSTPQRGIAAGRVHYRIFLVGKSRGAPIPVLQNRVTGEPVPPLSWDAGTPIGQGASWSPWAFPPESPEPRTWSGTIRLTETLRLGWGDTLRITPGTTIQVGPDISIVSEAPILAGGTPDHPIRITRLDPGRPWGAVALQGPGASGSRFRHLIVDGGGGALVDGIEYSGSVNVHLAQDVIFEDSRFSANARSDDMIHVLMGEVVIRRCEIVRANSDAIDYDYALGAIVDSRIRESGGDAIDLMGSNPVIVGNQILGSGDKGISIGEASEPTVLANTIAEGYRGIEVKDRSTPLILWNRLDNNQSGLALRQKNWRYGGGGWPRVFGLQIDGPESFTIDSVSGVTLPAPVDSLTLNTGVASSGIRRDTVDRALALTAGVALTRDGGSPQWQMVNPVPPRVEETFTDDFVPMDPWRMVNGERLMRRDGLLDLVVGREGSIAREIKWDLAVDHLLLLDLGGRDLKQIVVSIMSDSGSVILPLKPGRAQFSQAVIRVPPGRYREVRITAVPVARIERVQLSTGLTDLKRGHLFLRRLTLVPEP